MPVQKDKCSNTLGYIMRLLVISIVAVQLTSACTGCNEPSSSSRHQPTPRETRQLPTLVISSLGYEPDTGSITCMLKNQDQKDASLAGELKLQITPGQATKATIQGVTLQDGKYTTVLDKKLFTGGASLTKTFTIVQPSTETTSEFTSQIIYYNENGVREPVGSPATVICSQLATSLELRDLHIDTAIGQVSCTVVNQSKKPLTNVIINWENKTNGTQITQGGKAIQEINIGNLDAEKEQPNMVVGQLNFGSNASAVFTFWVTCAGDAIRHSEQTIEFHNSFPVRLTLTPVGPIKLETAANKVFKVKVVQQADSGPIDTSQVEFKFTQPYYPDSSAKILYNNQAITSLIGTDLTGNIVDQLEFVVDPGTEEHVIFCVEVLYDGQEHGKVRFDWYKQEAKDAFEAIHRIDFEAFQKKLDLTKINEHYPVKDGWGAGDTLLIRVIRSLDNDTGLKYIEELLKNGADPNISNSVDGFTPLHYAITKGRETIIDRLLADEKLNLTTLSQWGYSPFHATAEKGNKKIMQALLDKLKKQGKNEKQIADLLNTQDTRTGKTPLILAAEIQLNYRIDIVTLLLENGANPDILDHQNNSPLHRVTHKQDIKTAKALLQISKKKINQPNNDGETPLHTAVWYGNVEMVQLLLDNGASESINIKNNKGLTPAGYLSDKEGNFRFMSESDKKTMKELLTPTTP